MSLYLNQQDAKALDVDLLSSFSLDQLMELAGLSVATAISLEVETPCYVLLLIGPGNNGGDGLVAARHLKHFGYQVELIYPKVNQTPFFTKLLEQCKDLEIPMYDAWSPREKLPDVIVDALFGFGFKGPVRDPYTAIMQNVIASSIPIISIDIPSGWDVEEGEKPGSFSPYMLISLTAPKPCAQYFMGIHYVGGRFVPPNLVEKYHLQIPDYPNSSLVMKM